MREFATFQEQNVNKREISSRNSNLSFSVNVKDYNMNFEKRRGGLIPSKKQDKIYYLGEARNWKRDYTKSRALVDCPIHKNYLKIMKMK